VKMLVTGRYGRDAAFAAEAQLVNADFLFTRISNMLRMILRMRMPSGP
jgi:hypothetical protein